jgi:hypothetical protein
VIPFVFRPLEVAALVARLSEDEAEELDAYANEGADPTEYVTLASAWLVRRFGQAKAGRDAN